jgi:type VI secretion system secreted protein VgrG
MASSFTQGTRPVQITTPLGQDKFIVRSYSGQEAVCGLFRYQIELLSQDSAVDFSAILGKSVTLTIPCSSGSSRYINGVVGRFTQVRSDAEFTYYSVDLHPWLWMLTHSRNCAIYQNMSTPDIVKKVFSDLGFSDFTDSLTGQYTARDYCVQYRETAFDFVSRLMEQEGIFYFFTHDSSSHKLVLADDSSGWGTPAGSGAAVYGPDEQAWTTDEKVTDCSLEQNVTAGKYQVDDYNFETPSTDLLASAAGSDTSRSVYDFPGLYTAQSDGETIAGRMLSALEVPAKMVRGASLCRSFQAGAKFTLSAHTRSDANGEYVVLSLEIEGTQESYSNTFVAIASATTYRPIPVTPTPRIVGTQSAIVTGKAGEEIYTDPYGRIKVQFYWDQKGNNDEKTTCWIRVAQGWAGKQYGAFFLPRVGQEVLVTFLEGNPDRPVVVGSLYNATQTVPYTLPDNQTRSTVKTNSSKGGNGYNEIRFEDKDGSEEIFVQAQKDMNVTILNNLATTVKVDETRTVDGKRTLTVTGDETHTNSGNYTLKVTGNLTIDVSGSVTIKAGTSLSTKAGTSITNNAGTDFTNEAGATMTNKAAASETVDGGGMLILKGGLIKLN